MYIIKNIVKKRKFLRLFFTYAEFSLALLFFVAAPIAFPQRDFSLPSIRSALLFALFGLWFLMSLRFTRVQIQGGGSSSWLKRICLASGTLGLLCAFGLAWDALAKAARDIPVEKNFFFQGEMPVSLPLIAAITIFAFFEEILYRVYLPLRMSYFLRRKGIPELICVVLFAAAHRNGGLFSVLNALCSGYVLQYCFTKTRSVFLIGITHALYNVFALVFLYR
jgi:membrane protease YdiL (CAAX protease family)